MINDIASNFVICLIFSYITGKTLLKTKTIWQLWGMRQRVSNISEHHFEPWSDHNWNFSPVQRCSSNINTLALTALLLKVQLQSMVRTFPSPVILQCFLIICRRFGLNDMCIWSCDQGCYMTSQNAVEFQVCVPNVSQNKSIHLWDH